MDRKNPISTSPLNESAAMTRQFKLLAFTGFVLAAPVLLSAQNSNQTPSPAVMQADDAA
jgi:hypothetical protein